MIQFLVDTSASTLDSIHLSTLYHQHERSCLFTEQSELSTWRGPHEKIERRVKIHTTAWENCVFEIHYTLFIYKKVVYKKVVLENQYFQ